MGKEKIIPFFAMAVLLIGTFSTLYVHATQSSLAATGNSIKINNVEYSITDFFNTFTPITIQTDDGNKTGILLQELIIFTGVSCPTCYNYYIIAADGYRQTVSWENMQTGIFTEDHRVYFPGLAHSFWVRNVVEIEVK